MILTLISHLSTYIFSVQLSYTMSEPQHQSMIKSYTDQIVVMITHQLKQLHTRHLTDSADDNHRDAVVKLHTMCTTLIIEVCRP